MIIKGLENVHPEAAFIVVRDFNRTNMKKVLPKYHQHSDVKFAEDTTIVGLITDSDESAYREEVDTLTTWCQDNNLSLNVSKTKEMIVDYSRQQEEEHAPLHINRSEVERVSCFRFLGVHISDDLFWSALTDKVLKVARKRLFFLETEEVWHGLKSSSQTSADAR